MGLPDLHGVHFSVLNLAHLFGCIRDTVLAAAASLAPPPDSACICLPVDLAGLIKAHVQSKLATELILLNSCSLTINEQYLSNLLDSAAPHSAQPTSQHSIALRVVRQIAALASDCFSLARFARTYGVDVLFLIDGHSRNDQTFRHDHAQEMSVCGLVSVFSRTLLTMANGEGVAQLAHLTPEAQWTAFRDTLLMGNARVGAAASNTHIRTALMSLFGAHDDGELRLKVEHELTILGVAPSAALFPTWTMVRSVCGFIHPAFIRVCFFDVFNALCEKHNTCCNGGAAQRICTIVPAFDLGADSGFHNLARQGNVPSTTFDDAARLLASNATYTRVFGVFSDDTDVESMMSVTCCSNPPAPTASDASDQILVGQVHCLLQ